MSETYAAILAWYHTWPRSAKWWFWIIVASLIIDNWQWTIPTLCIVGAVVYIKRERARRWQKCQAEITKLEIDLGLRTKADD